MSTLAFLRGGAYQTLNASYRAVEKPRSFRKEERALYHVQPPIVANRATILLREPICLTQRQTRRRP